jgi:hypothetical protein
MLTAILTISTVAQAQSGAAPTTLIGCVQKAGSVYTLTDEASKVTAQLRGGSLKKGKHVQVTGTPVANASPAGGATAVLDVTAVTPSAGSCQAATVAGSSFTSAPATKRATIVSIFVITAVIAGTAVAVISRQGSARGNTIPSNN